MHQAEATLSRFRHIDLLEFSRRCFFKVGLPDTDASLVADHLVSANLRGVDSHGVVRIPYYVEGFEKGYLKPRAELKLLREGPTWALLDCGMGLGIVGATRASEIAAEKSLTLGVAVVGAVNIGHTGMLAYYTKRIAERGVVGVAMVNGVAEMPPWGGIGRVFGTNPISMAIPRRDSPPILVDMATSAIAKFKVHLAAARGEMLPEGVALDDEGKPTRDPAEALKGCLLPFGGHKGYSLALFIELMASSLIGAPRSVDVRDHPSQQGGLLILAINPEVFGDKTLFLERVESVVRALKSVRKAEDVQEILLPGEPEERTMRERLKNGVPLDQNTVKRLREVGERLGITHPPPINL
ncbi:MAG: Ldh family oxidoreductase [Nitrososphaerota archaeon]|nr:Ldh family oxidoreductase [Candidatus Calditenuaceae archaeon]MDW8073385.1 Ldh family oxidoreductase [Nitrososphaerota archaeon]